MYRGYYVSQVGSAARCPLFHPLSGLWSSFIGAVYPRLRQMLKVVCVSFLIHKILFLHDGRFCKVLKVCVINCSVYPMLFSSIMLLAKCCFKSSSVEFCESSLIIIPVIIALVCMTRSVVVSETVVCRLVLLYASFYSEFVL